MPSCLFLNTFYNPFLRNHYRLNQNLMRASYDHQKDSIQSQCVGGSDFYSKGLQKAGWDTDDIIMNCPPLQNTWSRENEFNGDALDIVVAQIRAAKPDVVYLQDMHFATNDFLHRVKEETQLLVANTGSALRPTVDIRLFDIIFSADPAAVEQFRHTGVVSYYQSHAFDPRILDRLKHLNGREHPVTFVGGLSQLHKRRIDFLELLARFVEVDCWGYGRDSLEADSPLLRRHKGEAWGLEMFSLLSRSLVTINIDGSPDCGGNLRVYEATGCGALLITDYQENLSDLFDLGREIVVYRSPDECAALVRYYMNNRKEAAEIAKAGQARTLRDYTYAKRMESESEIMRRHLQHKHQKQNSKPASIQPPDGGFEDPDGWTLDIERCGDQDCGWNVIPGLLGKDSVIYCVGCGENISFDIDLMRRLGCRIHAFDPTPKSLEYLHSLDLPESYHIFKYGLAHFDGFTKFNPPVNLEHVSHTMCDRPATADRAISVPMKRLKTIMQELGHDRIDLLKIDIEGAEYGVLDDLVKKDIPVGQICVEFHHFLDGHKIENTLQSIIQLIQSQYLLYAVHKHTDYCFLRKSLLTICPRPFSDSNPQSRAHA